MPLDDDGTRFAEARVGRVPRLHLVLPHVPSYGVY